jgi:CheY-like chemotaxis protein
MKKNYLKEEVMFKKVNCVLLVDDDNVSVFLSEKFIRSLDITHEIKIAPNGEMALKYLLECSSFGEPFPELILLDISMPVMDAFDFLQAYGNMNSDTIPKIAIAILTTSSNPRDIERLTNFGIVDYINKPLTHEKLIHFMEKHFNEDDE